MFHLQAKTHVLLSMRFLKKYLKSLFIFLFYKMTFKRLKVNKNEKLTRKETLQRLNNDCLLNKKCFKSNVKNSISDIYDRMYNKQAAMYELAQRSKYKIAIKGIEDEDEQHETISLTESQLETFLSKYKKEIIEEYLKNNYESMREKIIDEYEEEKRNKRKQLKLIKETEENDKEPQVSIGRTALS